MYIYIYIYYINSHIHMYTDLCAFRYKSTEPSSSKALATEAPVSTTLWSTWVLVQELNLSYHNVGIYKGFCKGSIVRV